MGANSNRYSSRMGLLAGCEASSYNEDVNRLARERVPRFFSRNGRLMLPARVLATPGRHFSRTLQK